MENGSLIINPTNPYFTITAERASPTAGTYLNKIGHETGWTYGAVIRTCEVESIRVNGVKYHITCAYKMNAKAEKGDSGSPIFYWNGVSDEVELAGLLYGTTTSSSKVYFSSLAAIKLDLGDMQTADPN